MDTVSGLRPAFRTAAHFGLSYGVSGSRCSSSGTSLDKFHEMRGIYAAGRSLVGQAEVFPDLAYLGCAIRMSLIIKNAGRNSANPVMGDAYLPSCHQGAVFDCINILSCFQTWAFHMKGGHRQYLDEPIDSRAGDPHVNQNPHYLHCIWYFCADEEFHARTRFT